MRTHHPRRFEEQYKTAGRTPLIRKTRGHIFQVARYILIGNL